MDKIYPEEHIQAIANAIRRKNGKSVNYLTSEMAGAIDQLVSYPEPTGTQTITENGIVDVKDKEYADVNVQATPTLISKTITANGEYDAEDDEADGYSDVTVNVPNSYVAADEGKVVSSGALVAQTSTTKTANGTYDTTENNEVVVAVENSYTAADEGKVVSNGALVAQTSTTVTQNGTYDTTENDEVVVNVSGGGSAVVQSLSVTQNGTYTPPSGVDGYAPVTVNVSGGGSKPSSAGVITSQNVIVDYNAQTLETYFNDLLHDFDNLLGYLYTTNQMASDIDSTKSYTCYIVCRETSVQMKRLMGFAGISESSGKVPGVYTNNNGIVCTTLYSSDVSTGINGTNFVAACVIIDRSNNQVRYAVNSYRETKNATMYAWNKVSVNGQNGNYVGQMEIKHFALVEGADDASTVDANINALMTLYGIQ